MKKILLLFFVIFTGLASAQSDFETTQDFKEKAKVISNTIKNIQTDLEIERTVNAIKKLRIDFEKHKDLLDKALYPDDFEKVFEKLNKSLKLKKRDIKKLNNLENKITDLRVQITDLNDKNKVLLGEIKGLTKLRTEDSVKIAELKSKVKVLGKQIRERDALVLGMVDSLLTDFVNQPEPITDVAKNNLKRKIESRNLFANIERTIQDNIDFLDLTIFSPEDLVELKKQNREFRKVWNKLGPQLTSYYLNIAEKKEELQNIEKMFNKWENKINHSVWANVNHYFENYDIKLLPYNDGSEFTANILAYITLELNKMEKIPEEELLKTYYTFSDSVWTKEISINWVPMLIENGYLTFEQQSTIDSKLMEWEYSLYDNHLTSIYIIFGILFLIFVAAIIKRYKK